MRVTMFTGDYVPMFVLHADEEDLALLKRNAGDHIQVAMPFMDRFHNLRANDPIPNSPVFSVMLLVEGVEWGDGATRPILVANGLRSRNIPEAARMDDMAHTIYGAALDAARRRGGDRPSTASEGRARMEAARIAAYQEIAPMQVPAMLGEPLSLSRSNVQRVQIFRTPEAVRYQINPEEMLSANVAADLAANAGTAARDAANAAAAVAGYADEDPTWVRPAPPRRPR